MNYELVENDFWKGEEFFSLAGKVGLAYLFVFHGSRMTDAAFSSRRFVQKVAHGTFPATAAYLNENVLSEQERAFFLPTVLDRLHAFGAKVVLCPMLLQKGIYYDKLLKQAAPFSPTIIDVFSDDVLRSLLDFPSDSARIVMIHPSRNTSLYERLKSLCAPHTYICRNLDDIRQLSLPQHVVLDALYLQSGEDMTISVFGETDSIYAALCEAGHSVEKRICPIIERTEFAEKVRGMLSKRNNPCNTDSERPTAH